MNPILEDVEPVEFDYNLCPTCGSVREWVECWQCDDGIIDSETLMEEDPLWYDENSYEMCEICAGCGGWHHCFHCAGGPP